jgi:hypothetical protein
MVSEPAADFRHLSRDSKSDNNSFIYSDNVHFGIYTMTLFERVSCPVFSFWRQISKNCPSCNSVIYRPIRMKLDMQTQNREACAVLFSNWTTGAIFTVQSEGQNSQFRRALDSEIALPIYTVLYVFDAYWVFLDENAIDIPIRSCVWGAVFPQLSKCPKM